MAGGTAAAAEEAAAAVSPSCSAASASRVPEAADRSVGAISSQQMRHLWSMRSTSAAVALCSALMRTLAMDSRVVWNSCMRGRPQNMKDTKNEKRKPAERKPGSTALAAALGMRA